MSSLKNMGSTTPGEAADPRAKVLAFGPFEFDTRTGLLVGEGVERVLAPKPAAVLDLLLRSSGQLVTKSTMLDRVWEGLAVNEHALADTISVLRQTLGDNARAPTYIQTLHRRGYRFISSVRESSAPGGHDEKTTAPKPEAARGWGSKRITSTALVLAAATLFAAIITAFGQAVRGTSPLPLSPAQRAKTAVEMEDGFYLDDPFGTGQPAYAEGHRVPDAAAGETLRVTLGGVDDQRIVGMSGGWGLQFQIPTARAMRLSFRYNLTLQPDYERDEYTEAVVTLDGARLGVRYPGAVDRLTGNGNGGRVQQTGWQSVTLYLGVVPAGRHTLVFGAFGNKKTYRNEVADVRYADLRIAYAD